MTTPLAVVTTCVCLLLAYPIAYILARSKWKSKAVIVVMFVMPMWINFTLRITALQCSYCIGAGEKSGQVAKGKFPLTIGKSIIYYDQKRCRHKADVVMFVMPMWINFTLRITALKEILTLIEGNLAFHPFLNTIIGMTYDFLPFMILPMYMLYSISSTT